MDVVVQLADGRYLNVEIQKIGYRFPAECTDAIWMTSSCVSIITSSGKGA